MIKTSERATDNCLKYLYNYQRFNKEYFAPTLSKKAIYCSDPNKFNDPWDCKPSYNTEILSDPGEYECCVKFIADKVRAQSSISEEDIPDLIDHLAGNLERLEKTLNCWSESLGEGYAKTFRVYCLTPDPCNTLMWSHYGDKHQGICLEFETNNRVFGGAWKVEYRDTYPPHRYDQADHDQMSKLLTKSDVWKYENEYRIVARKPTGDRFYDESHLCLLEGDFLPLPEQALKSVIVGCQAPYDEIREFVNSIDPHLPVRRAVRLRDRYALRIE